MFPRLSQFTEGKVMIEFNFFSLTDYFFFPEQHYSNTLQSSSMPGIEKKETAG